MWHRQRPSIPPTKLATTYTHTQPPPTKKQCPRRRLRQGSWRCWSMARRASRGMYSSESRYAHATTHTHACVRRLLIYSSTDRSSPPARQVHTPSQILPDTPDRIDPPTHPCIHPSPSKFVCEYIAKTLRTARSPSASTNSAAAAAGVGAGAASSILTWGIAGRSQTKLEVCVCLGGGVFFFFFKCGV